MQSKEEGELELVLGNRQLLSVLFIVIVLLGIFFAMGFLAGRSTCPAAISKGSQASQPPEADSQIRTVEPAAPPPRASTQVTAVPQSSAQKSEPAATPSSPPLAPVEPPARPAPPPTAQKGSVVVEAPPAGTYVQAAATRLPDAETMMALFRQEGLKGYITPSPKSPDVFRVIIGPLSDNEAIAAAREALAKHGIKAPYVVKY